MENTAAITTLAKNNINILEVRPYQGGMLVAFEFQWRDPRNYNHRWSKSVIFEKESTDLAQTILNLVRGARKELEG